MRDGEPLPLGGPRQRAVLARLLVEAGRVVPAAALIEDVWAGAPPATAAKTLQRYVWRIRRTLCDPDVLRTRSRGYQLEPGSEALDAGRFERLLAVANEARARGDLAAAAGTFREALALWRGDVLADLPDASFAAPERARLSELRLAALERRLDGEVTLGRAAEVAAEAADLVETHPLRERLWAVLMRAYARSGRQVDALRAFERYRRLLAEEFGLEPSSELRDLERSILAADDTSTCSDTDGRELVPGSLPATATSLLGRAEQLVGIESALAGSRLVTLTGPAGVGKTRLAVEVALRQRAVTPGGVWFVELATHQGYAVPEAVAAVLGVAAQPGEALDNTVVAALAHRPPLLLVLDNCEHLLEATAAFADAVLRRCPSVQLLATSRHPLGLDAETRWSVPALGDEAVELFADRARRAAPGFEVTPENRPVVGELCRRLDGLPLAIELAASQVRVLEPGEIVDRLDDRFGLLVRPHSATPRHRTMEATIAWSHELLAPAARTVLARLGVFAGSFTLDAAETVCAGDGIAHRDVLRCITDLVDHSLLVREPGPTDVARYRLLETIRIFAVEQLRRSGELESRHAAHARHYLALAREADPNFYGPDEVWWRERLRADDPNFDAALHWTAHHHPELSARLAIALWFYWDATWRERRAVEYLAPLLDPDSAVPADQRGWTLVVAASLGSHQGDARTPMDWSRRAVEVFTRLGHDIGLAWAHHALGHVLVNHGALDRAEESLRWALDAFRRHGDQRATGLTLSVLGVVSLRRGDYLAAERLHLEELAVWRAVGTPLGQGTALRRLAIARLRLGDLPAAAQACGRARDLFTRLDDAASVAHVVSIEGDIARGRGDDETATSLFKQAMESFGAIGDRRCTASAYRSLATVAARSGDHDRALALFREAIVLRQELGDVAGIAECLEGLAGCSIGRGDPVGAAELLGMSAALRQATGARRDGADREMVAHVADAAKAALGAEEYEIAEAATSELSPAEMVERVLTGP